MIFYKNRITLCIICVLCNFECIRHLPHGVSMCVCARLLSLVQLFATP